jgi:hypothetical protein
MGGDRPNVVAEELGQQKALRPVLPLNKALHSSPEPVDSISPFGFSPSVFSRGRDRASDIPPVPDFVSL